MGHDNSNLPPGITQDHPIWNDEPCDACEGTGYNFYSCCGDDMRGKDLDFCPSCREHTGWDGESCGDCPECNGSGIKK